MHRPGSIPIPQVSVVVRGILDDSIERENDVQRSERSSARIDNLLVILPQNHPQTRSPAHR
ncbi:MAG: hypothetical protein ACLR6B_16395 [Blautia sp.]